MTCGKIQQELDDFVTGRLVPAEKSEVERHLLTCRECRSYAVWIGDLDLKAAALPDTIEPSRDLWPDILSRISARPDRSAHIIRLPGRSDTPALPAPKSAGSARRGSRPLPIAAAFFVLIALSSLLTLNVQQPNEQTAWTVTGLAGTPMIGVRPASEGGSLPVGEWLETDGASRAEIEVANIGQVELRPNSRLRVLRSGANEHRMALDKGSMSALILAPPRLFFVETPSALAVDLGCAYELTVDSKGNGHLAVTAGWVALEYEGRQSLVPAGASCVSRPGSGPGTPYFTDASADFQTALNEIDLGFSLDAALGELLRKSRVRDTLSLWHLLPRLSAERRELVWERLNELLPAPEGVTREGILGLNQPMLDRWKDDLEQFWF
ncbi:MAG: hypothetical protein EHM23_11965 [Acidobacteria bacterium]|nr:MAG: hypothetical protein EHM23_11965 [Acidobacteriota bacterium]